jgi:hypothetical protein
MNQKSTDELLEIWKANDQEQYSEETFAIVRVLFEERGSEIPPQEVFTNEEFVPVKLTPNITGIWVGVAFMSLGIIMFIQQVISLKPDLARSLAIICTTPMPAIIGGLLLVKRAYSPPVTFGQGALTLIGGIFVGGAIGRVCLYVIVVAMMDGEAWLDMTAVFGIFLFGLLFLYLGFRSPQKTH